MPKDYSWQDFPNADFSGADLEEANLSAAIFNGANLSNANLVGCNSDTDALHGARKCGRHAACRYVWTHPTRSRWSSSHVMSNSSDC